MEHPDLLSPEEMQALLAGERGGPGGAEAAGPEPPAADGDALLREFVQLLLTGAFHSGALEGWKARWVEVAPPYRKGTPAAADIVLERVLRLEGGLPGLLALRLQVGQEGPGAEGSGPAAAVRLVETLSGDLPTRIGRLLGLSVKATVLPGPFAEHAAAAPSPWLHFPGSFQLATGERWRFDVALSADAAAALAALLNGGNQEGKGEAAPAGAEPPLPPGAPGPSNGHGAGRLVSAPEGGPRPAIKPLRFAPLRPEPPRNGDGIGLDALHDLPVTLTVELGRAKATLEEIMAWAPGTIIELDRLAGEMVDVLVNGKPVAKGEVVVMEDTFSVKVTDIVTPLARIPGLV